MGFLFEHFQFVVHFNTINRFNKVPNSIKITFIHTIFNVNYNLTTVLVDYINANRIMVVIVIVFDDYNIIGTIEDDIVAFIVSNSIPYSVFIHIISIN